MKIKSGLRNEIIFPNQYFWYSLSFTKQIMNPESNCHELLKINDLNFNLNDAYDTRSGTLSVFSDNKKHKFNNFIVTLAMRKKNRITARFRLKISYQIRDVVA